MRQDIRNIRDPSESTTGGFDALAAELERRFRSDAYGAWADFGDLAVRVFAHQFEAVSPYRAFCERRGVTPDSIARWEEVPLVPADAFKHLDFSCTPVGGAEAVFLTSGTTRGDSARGRHVVPRLSLYRASLLEPFRRALLPDVDAMAFVSLIPSPEKVPDSSLSFMVGAAAEELSTEAHWVVGADGSLDGDGLAAALDAVAVAGEPVLLLGTALAFAHVLGRADVALGALPEGSRVMETGGFKGLDREVSRSELYDRIVAASGVPTGRIVNEYGMTELLSQLYEPVLSEGPEGARVHVPPPWLRVRALDPVTLEPLPAGDEGLLAFFDLANLGSVSHVLTEDVGSVSGGRVRLRGRVAGAEPRGCSRAMDELMSAAGSAR